MHDQSTAPPGDTRICKACGLTKPITDFCRRGRDDDRLRRRCRDCRTAAHQRWRPTSPRTGKHGPAAQPVAERFWPKVDRSGGPDACWPWCGSFVSGKLYGQFAFAHDDNRRAHRVAWELTHGSIPPGMVVCHACDNPACCNPAHLWLGTQADNSHDRDAKGRAPSGDRHWLRLNPERLPTSAMRSRPGEAHPHAKLTDEDVLAIRRAWADGETGVSIAGRFSISGPHVSAIVRRKKWKHLP